MGLSNRFYRGDLKRLFFLLCLDDYQRSIWGHHDTNLTVSNLSIWLSITCPRFWPILANLGGQVTNSQVDKLLTIKFVFQDRNFGQTQGGRWFWEIEQRRKEEKGGQLTNTPKGVKVDNLLTLQHAYIYIYISYLRSMCAPCPDNTVSYFYLPFSPPILSLKLSLLLPLLQKSVSKCLSQTLSLSLSLFTSVNLSPSNFPSLFLSLAPPLWQ